MYVRLECLEGPWSGGVFEFSFVIPPQYPFAPPIVRCLTQVLHPNISLRTGEVSLLCLASDWKPGQVLRVFVFTLSHSVLSLNHVLLMLQLVFLEPHTLAENATATAFRQDVCSYLGSVCGSLPEILPRLSMDVIGVIRAYVFSESSLESAVYDMVSSCGSVCVCHRFVQAELTMRGGEFFGQHWPSNNGVQSSEQ